MAPFLWTEAPDRGAACRGGFLEARKHSPGMGLAEGFWPDQLLYERLPIRVLMQLLSIQIGTLKTFGVPGSDDPIDRVFTSAIDKTPVSGRVWVGSLGLSGDTVADRRHHGGHDQALLAYAGQHY